jgi:hypothetical protein
MTPEETRENINPQVREVQIGIRTLRTIKIYPLSLGHQFKLSTIITDIFKRVSEDNDKSDARFFSVMVEAVFANFSKVMSYVALDEGDCGKMADEVTNDQITAILTHLYKDNYEGPVKNAMSLFTAAKDAQLKRPLQQSANDMDIDSIMSIVGPSKTEA